MNNSSIIDILVPNLPESVTDAVIAVWHKNVGNSVKHGEILLEIETDKIMLEIPAVKNGILQRILEQEGAVVVSGQILGHLICHDQVLSQQTEIQHKISNQKKYDISDLKNFSIKDDKYQDILTPSIRKLMAEHNITLENIQGTGLKGRLTRQDIETYIHNIEIKNKNISKSNDRNLFHDATNEKKNTITHIQKDTRIKMNRLRKRIAERLLNVTNTTAMLTTFNEVNMQPIIKIRKKYGETFLKHHGIKLGFMSFYIKAVVCGLKRFPDINASIDGEEIVYHNYFDISIAVSTIRGLITPVLRNVDIMNLSEIESHLKCLADRGRDGKLTLDELQGGNFTITNGGIFGSLMSTPILNPPQSAILGMHVIKERPVALNGQIIILPMMYLALSYDHRLIDGKDSVNFLVYIKELLEDPIRFLLDI